MPFIKLESRSLNTYYELQGDPKKPPLVLINGLTRDHTAWLKMLPELIDDYYVLIFDNRGVGQTEDAGRAFTVDTLADDAITLINELGLVRPFVAGHSLGGAITQMMAKKYPMRMRQIALCNTFIKLNASARHAFQNVVILQKKGASRTEITDAIIPWVFSKSFVTPEVRTMIDTLNSNNPYPQSLENYQRQLEALNQFDSMAWVSDIELEALVIASKEGITATYQEAETLAALMPKATLEILPGGHASYAEQPGLFVEALKAFFKA